MASFKQLTLEMEDLNMKLINVYKVGGEAWGRVQTTVN